MSSIVNKSKNKFVPKAKSRPRIVSPAPHPHPTLPTGPTIVTIAAQNRADDIEDPSNGRNKEPTPRDTNRRPPMSEDARNASSCLRVTAEGAPSFQRLSEEPPGSQNRNQGLPRPLDPSKGPPRPQDPDQGILDPRAPGEEPSQRGREAGPPPLSDTGELSRLRVSNEGPPRLRVSSEESPRPRRRNERPPTLLDNSGQSPLTSPQISGQATLIPRPDQREASLTRGTISPAPVALETEGLNSSVRSDSPDQLPRSRTVSDIITGIAREGERAAVGSQSTSSGRATSKRKGAPSVEVVSRPRQKRQRAQAAKTEAESTYQDQQVDETDSVDASDNDDLERRGNEKHSRSKAKGPIKTIKRRAPRKKRGSTGGRKRRAETPEDAEGRIIEENTVRMKELCKDPLIGKKSKRFKELAEMDWAELVRKQRAAKEELEARKARGEVIREETDEERLERLAQSSGQPAAAPQVRFVNGRIVLDEESLRIDRHQRDVVEDGALEIVEENAHTRLVNSGTWSKREKAEKWDKASTERFYEGLSMFGIDFECISKLFPGRSRRQMKNKLRCEERKNPELVSKALKTKIPIDMVEYSDIAATRFREVADLERELRQLEAEHEAEAEQMKTHAAQMERERQEQVNADMKADVERQHETHPRKARKRNQPREAEPREEILSMSLEEYQAMRRQQEEDDY